jgi:hypothetical protein
MRENFVIVTDVRALPESVKGSFCNVEKCNFVGVKFDMVNPGEAMSTDYIISRSSEQTTPVRSSERAIPRLCSISGAVLQINFAGRRLTFENTPRGVPV